MEPLLQPSKRRFVLFPIQYHVSVFAKPLQSKSPKNFDFMDMISMQGKTNFFERRVSESKANFDHSSNSITSRRQLCYISIA